MTRHELTNDAGLATFAPMRISKATPRRWRALAALAAITPALGGCITVNAPEEPIVIELNVNIRQEVIYRLAEDAGNTIEENADIF